MKYTIDKFMLLDFIKENYKNKLEFSKELQVSYSHLNYILKENTKINEITYLKLEKIMQNKNVDIKDFLISKPIYLGDKAIRYIDIFQNGDLMCSISSENIICENNVKVKCRPL